MDSFYKIIQHVDDAEDKSDREILADYIYEDGLFSLQKQVAHINNMVKDLDISEIPLPSKSAHTLSHLANINDILYPKETLENSPLLMALYTLSMDEVNKLEATTHPTRKQTFKDRKYDWTLTKAQLESFSVIIDIIEAQPPSAAKDAKAAEIFKQIQVFCNIIT